MRIKEFKPRTIVIFDIDDTLVHTQTKVHVVKDGQVIRSLNSHEFTHYKLQPGEEFDFGDFRDAREFFEKSKPIIPMINQLKRDIAIGNKVVMVTARADFNDRELFLDTFRKYGVDMSKVHVYRAGNMHIKAQTEEKKKIIIRDLLGKELYTKAIMYDDAEPNLHAFISLKNEYPHTKFYAWHVSLDGEASEYHRTDESLAEDQSDYEIRNYKKLDKILVELCNEIVEGQKTDPDLYGMVAACVLDPDNNRTTSTSTKDGDQWKHAERNAMDAYNKIYGDIPDGSIIITTLSPCSEHMDDRYGESCTDLINQSRVKKVYSGYTDPTQEEEHREFNIMETENASIRDLCKKFADTFLDDLHEGWSQKYKNSINCSHPKGFSQKAHCAGKAKNENFADGRNPQDKGDSKRYGVPTKASVSTLRKVAKQGGRKGQLAHWMANMKAGKKK